MLTFAWDQTLTEDALRRAIADEAHPDHDRLLSLLLREARPDEVWAYTTPQHVADHLDRLLPRLGRKKAFWPWLIGAWRELGFLP